MSEIDLARFPEENPNPVLRVTADGTLLYANQASQRLLDQWGVRVGQPVPLALRERIDAALAQGIAYDLVQECPPAVYALQIMPVPASGYANVYALDVSQARSDQALAAARDAALNANRALRHMNEEFRRSNEELEMFTSVVAHDLRAPLRAIEQLAEWVVDDAGEHLSGEPLEHLNLIAQRARRAMRLIESLHQYALLGGDRAAVEPVDLVGLVDDAFSTVEAPPGFSLEKNIVVGPFETAAIALRQVLYNLINNAVKHHDREDGHIVVSAIEEGDFVRIDVADDGPGIDPAHHDKIFHIFATLKSRDRVDSSGMGLAFVKKHVSLVGGRVTVASDGQRGTVFTVMWPRSEDEDTRLTIPPASTRM